MSYIDHGKQFLNRFWLIQTIYSRFLDKITKNPQWLLKYIAFEFIISRYTSWGDVIGEEKYVRERI